MMTALLGLTVLLAWPVAEARANPEEDFRAGSRAFQGGDVVQAMALLKKSADAGHAPSQSLLGYILDKAEFNDEAIAYYRKAAAQKDPDGQFGLGTMYASGEGVKRDFVEARKWITLAAEKGHAGAINALAQAYISGELGIGEAERNGGEALRWIRRAADTGHLPAVERLAVAYRTGAYGLAVDAQQAQSFEAKAKALRGTADKPPAKKRERK